MKNKFWSLLLFASIALTGCGNATHELKLKVLTPNGAPAVAFYNYANDANFETNAKPANIIASMNNGEYEAIVIDTTSGLKAITTAKAPYQIAATITLGNFFIASTGNDEDKKMNNDDTIVLFGTENAVPSKIFHFLYGDIYDEHIEYVANVAMANKCLMEGKNTGTGHTVDYVFIAQPVLYKDLQNSKKVEVYKDIQEEYKKKSNNLPLMQASIFIKNEADHKIVDSLLKNLKNDIEKGIKNPSLIKKGIDQITDKEIAKTRFGVDSETIEKVMENNGLGLGYLNSFENKESIDKYIGLFNMGETSEEIYYQ